MSGTIAVAVHSIATSLTQHVCMFCTTLSFELSPLTVHMNRNPPLSSVKLAIRQANKTVLGETLSTTGDLAKTVADWTAVIANVLQDVLYVNGIAGIVTQIIKIRDVTLISLY